VALQFAFHLETRRTCETKLTVRFQSDIRLRGRPGPLRPLGVFDLLTEAGKVQPKALNPQTYKDKDAPSLALEWNN
jgi:hypothetical protein